MRQLNKKLPLFFLLAFLFLLSPVTCRAEEAPSSQLCGDDEYLLIMTEMTHMDIYDKNGTFLGNCRMNFADEHYGATVMKKSDVAAFSDGTDWEVFSLETLSPVLKLPFEDYHVSTCRGYTLAVSNQNGSFQLYDNKGKLKYSREEAYWDEPDDGMGNIFSTDSGMVFGPVRYFSEKAFTPCPPVWISTDGTQIRELDASVFANAFVNWSLSAFEDYLFVSDFENGIGTIYDLDGTPVMDQVLSTLLPYNYTVYTHSEPYVPQWLIRDNKEHMEVYDTSLSLHGYLPVSDDHYPICSDHYVAGIAYPELDYLPCAGFVRYNGNIWLPYARTQEGCIILKENKELVHFTLAPYESPVSFNDFYRVSEYVDASDNYHSRLIYRKTGETLKEYSWTDNASTTFELGKDSCMIYESDFLTPSLSKTTVLGPEGTPTYQDTSINCFPWSNGNLLLSRGPYRGIADSNGEWILRSLTAGME